MMTSTKVGVVGVCVCLWVCVCVCLWVGVPEFSYFNPMQHPLKHIYDRAPTATSNSLLTHPSFSFPFLLTLLPLLLTLPHSRFPFSHFLILFPLVTGNIIYIVAILAILYRCVVC